MHTILVSQLPEFVDFVVFMQNEVAMIWGGPGIAKTQLMRQVAAKHNAYLLPFHMSQYESVDLKGLPDRDGNTTIWLQPSTLPFVGNPKFDHIPDDQIILLFLDEMNANMMAILYQLVDERRVGEHILRDNVRIVAAGNREGDKGVTQRMPLPLANRMTHVEVTPDLEFFCKFIASEGLPPIGAAFLNFRKELMYTFDPSKPDKAFATWRTWEKALRYYASDAVGEGIKHAAMAGAIGEGPASEFWGFVEVWQKVQGLLPRILKDPENVAIPEEESMRYAIAVSVSGSIDDKNIGKLHTFLKRMSAELVVLAWTLALTRNEKLFTTPEFVQYAKEYKAVFQG